MEMQLHQRVRFMVCLILSKLYESDINQLQSHVVVVEMELGNYTQQNILNLYKIPNALCILEKVLKQIQSLVVKVHVDASSCGLPLQNESGTVPAPVHFLTRRYGALIHVKPFLWYR